MGKEFRNIDELYRSELGGTVTEAPAFVKGNIDSALGFGKRKAGYLLFGLIALLATVGITAAVLTNQYGANQVAQSDITTDEISETLNNTNSSNNSADGIAFDNESENGSNATSNTSGLNNEDGTATEGINDAASENLATNNSINDKAANGNQFGNYRTASTNTRTNGGQTNLNLNSGNGISPNPNQPNLTNNGAGPNNQVGPSDRLGNRDNGNPKGVVSGNTNSGSNDTDKDDTNKLIDKGNTGDSSNDLANNNGNQTNMDSGNSNDTVSNPDTPENNDPNLATNDPAITDDTNSNVDNTEKDSANDDNTSTTPTLLDPLAQNPVVINPPLKDSTKPLMISLTSGINLLRSNYTANDMNEETLYDNAFSDNIGNQTNLDITYRLKNGLTFGTGLGLNNYKESYEFTTYQPFIDTTEIFETVINAYEYEYDYYYSASIDSGVVSIDSIMFISDSTAYPVDTVYTYAYEKGQKGTKHNGQNKATYFTLPVHFGTQIVMKKFQLDLYASARFNFLMRSSGGYYNDYDNLNLYDDEISLFGNENSIYKPFYVDVLFASKLHYNFYKNLYLTGTVQYRPVMGNSFKAVPFNKTFDYMHVGLGLSIRL
ncbi:MAG: hypothetical protein GQ574_16885 [Crocinitomix sp.]|nr:hypothetical protein [Crocinitomix sp.]